MTSSFRKNSIVVESCMQRIAGLRRYAANETQIAIASGTRTGPEVVAMFQRSVDARAAVTRKEAELKAALAERDAAEKQRQVIDRQLGQWALHRFGEHSAALRDFGYAPPKVGKKTVETKQRAVEKARATRKARHTMGKKAKLKIKGKVE